MALDKKHSERGTIDSAEELDAYGVWVKSEPQDFTASLAGTANFDAEAVPYDADFDAGFGDLGVSDIDFGDSDTGIPGMDTESDEDSSFGEDSSFSEETEAYSEQVSEEASNRLLMKIAGELSSIKSELNSLKKEFAEIRAEGVSAASAPAATAGEKRGGFFADDGDEKIALTGDEMDHFLSSTDFSEEDGLGYDALREKDEAALKELSEQNEVSPEEAEESAETEESHEEIQIDFDNLGIDLESDTETETEEFPPLDEAFPEEDSLEASSSSVDDLVFPEPAADDDFGSSFDTLSLDAETADLGIPPALESEGLAHEEATGEFMEELSPLEDHEELRDLRLEGASPHTPAPDNIDYLEADPFVLDTSDFADTPLDGNALSEEAAFESAVSEEAASDDLVFSEDISGDMSDDISEDNTEDISFDDASFDIGLSDDFSIESPAETTTEAATEVAAETETTAEAATEVAEEPAAEELSVTGLDTDDLSFDDGSLEFSGTELDDADFSFDDGDTLELSTESSAIASDDSVVSAAEPAPPPEAEISEDDFDAEALDLSDAVIDEPDLSAGLVEAPLEEPVLGDISFDDDEISLEMDGFGTSDDTETAAKDSDHADTGRALVDDSLAQIIPEGFEVNAQEAPISGDDDLEAFTDDDLAMSAGTGVPTADDGEDKELAIPPGLKGELKSVLAYMDHLLESLPEDKIEEFAKSEYFDTYKKIFKELGLV